MVCRVNQGRGRKVWKDEMDEGMKVHRSVKTRLEAGQIFFDDHYVPRVRPSVPIVVHAKTRAERRRQVKELEHHEWNTDTPEHWEWVD